MFAWLFDLLKALFGGQERVRGHRRSRPGHHQRSKTVKVSSYHRRRGRH